MTRILLAVDKFKGTATAAEVAGALARGLAEHPGVQTVQVPVADGGDGTLEVCESLGWSLRSTRVTGPDGAAVRARFAWDEPRRRAVIEVAEACGMRLLTREGELPEDADAEAATSRSVGQLVLAALDAGAEEVVLGLGGSATTDAGFGMAQALGVRFLDEAGDPVEDPRRLAEVARADLSGLDARVRSVRFVAASDVTNPLLGPDGAAAVFGPQKGLAAERIETRDAALGRVAAAVEEAAVTGGVADRPGAGAAGGLGFMTLALLDARYASGVQTFLDLAGVDDLLEGTDLVVTGEGKLDEQTLRGKAPAGVAERAAERGIPVVAVCGQNTLPPGTQHPFQRILAMTDVEPDVRSCLRDPLPVLERLARGRLLA
ncbi:glycerate kinase [Rothia kristinae]|uniref:glycerate kinase n=1 Tax=Rothia kristinae TaxID=37923 RepID=UPI001643D9F8|nr:glycerate kinase [Rothia kristinae]